MQTWDFVISSVAGRCALKISSGILLLYYSFFVFYFYFIDLVHSWCFYFVGQSCTISDMLGPILFFGVVLWTFLFHALIYSHKFKRIKAVTLQLTTLRSHVILAKTWSMNRMKKVRYHFHSGFLVGFWQLKDLWLYINQDISCFISGSKCDGDDSKVSGGISTSVEKETIWVEGLVPGIDFCNHGMLLLFFHIKFRCLASLLVVSSILLQVVGLVARILFPFCNFLIIVQEKYFVNLSEFFMNRQLSNSLLYLFMWNTTVSISIIWLSRYKGSSNMGGWWNWLSDRNFFFYVPSFWYYFFLFE